MARQGTTPQGRAGRRGEYGQYLNKDSVLLLVPLGCASRLLLVSVSCINLLDQPTRMAVIWSVCSLSLHDASAHPLSCPALL